MWQRSIVVVEAYAAMGVMLDGLLTEAGYRVHLWSNGDSAFEFIQQQRPDLVILAYSLTRQGDGLPIIRQLCDHDVTNMIPIMVLADDSLGSAMCERFRETSHFEVLYPPIYLDVLKRKVEHIIAAPCGIVQASTQCSRHQRYAVGVAD